MMIRLDCIPPKTTAQQKRQLSTPKGPVFFHSKEQKQAIATYQALLLPHQPKEPVKGLVAVYLEFVWPWRKSDLATKHARELAKEWEVRRLGAKPDIDNIVKELIDQLVKLRFIEDDAKVVKLHASKFVGERPGVSISIGTVKDPWEAQ